MLFNIQFNIIYIQYNFFINNKHLLCPFLCLFSLLSVIYVFFSITLKDFMFPRLLPHQFLLAYVLPSVISEAFQYNPVNLATILNCRISELDPVFFLIRVCFQI